MKQSSIMFVNGVNTNFGGSGKNANAFWLGSIRKKMNTNVFDTVPHFGFKVRNPLYQFVLFLYFMPGSLFRIFRFPLFEFLIKVSLLNAIKFISAASRNPSDLFLFSHHSSFYLAFFVRKLRCIFLVHDLLYLRARNFGYSRQVSRIILKLEIILYARAHKILILSYQEWRILRRFLPNEVKLIACYDVTGLSYENSVELTRLKPKLVMVSDWRRPENLDGFKKFFLQQGHPLVIDSPIQVNIYGYGANRVIALSQKLQTSNAFIFVEYGSYCSTEDIDGDVYLVPIYQGAGIKIKTLEGISQGRMIIGTKGAFAGLPPYMVKYVGHIVMHPIDIIDKMRAIEDTNFAEFRRRYGELYCAINSCVG